MQCGTDCIVRQHPEAEVLVQRSIPRDLGVGREGDGEASGLRSPCAYAIDERTTDAGALVLGTYAYLLDVSVTVHVVDHDVTDRLTRNADGDPATAIFRVAREFFEGGWLVVSDRLQTDVAEALAGKPFDFL